MRKLEDFRLLARFFRSHGVDPVCITKIDRGAWLDYVSMAMEWHEEEMSFQERLDVQETEEQHKYREEQKRAEYERNLYWSAGR